MKFNFAGAVRSNPQCNNATVPDVQEVIKLSLRYSGDKNGGKKKRRWKNQRVRPDIITSEEENKESSEDSTENDSELANVSSISKFS